MSNLVGLCLTVLPFALIAYGALALMGIAQAGPREMPKTDPLNRRMALFFILSGIGLFFVTNQNQVLSFGGLALCGVALVLYSVDYSRSRKRYPEKSADEWYGELKKRYRFMNDPRSSEPKESKKDGEKNE